MKQGPNAPQRHRAHAKSGAGTPGHRITCQSEYPGTNTKDQGPLQVEGWKGHGSQYTNKALYTLYSQLPCRYPTYHVSNMTTSAHLRTTYAI
jgi:hypothetical protein